MKIKITSPDCNGHEVGDIVDVKGDTMPAWAVGKAEEVDGKKRVAVTNPTKGKAEEVGGKKRVAVTNPTKGKAEEVDGKKRVAVTNPAKGKAEEVDGEGSDA